MQVSVIGLGYIGLPTAALLSSKGIEVLGVDIDQNIVQTINNGNTHIIEPELDKIVKSSVKQGKLKADSVIRRSDVFIIAVPTPFKFNFKPDLSFIENAARSIAPKLEKDNLIILESTSPVGTSEKLRDILRKLRSDLSFPEYNQEAPSDISIAYCPERVLPGNILFELVNNDRVLGGISKKCALKAKEFYKLFIKSHCHLTDCRTAEMSKLVENSYRDVNIAFANELSIISDKLEINVWELIRLANHHPRVNILQPGPGVGGHCIAVDPWFIVDSAPSESKMIKLARLINNQKPQFVLNKINEAVVKSNKTVSELVVSCFGLAFKPDIDDLRESPAIEIASKINLMGFKKQYIVEPHITELPNKLKIQSIELIDSDEAIALSDIVILLVDHSAFKLIKKEAFSDKQIVDTRGIWSGV